MRTDEAWTRSFTCSIEELTDPAAVTETVTTCNPAVPEEPFTPKATGGNSTPRGDGYLQQMWSPGSRFSDSPWGESVPDLAGGWRRLSFGSNAASPNIREEACDEEILATGLSSTSEKQEYDEDQGEDELPSHWVLAEDLQVAPFPQSWDYPLSKSEKSKLLNVLCEQERAAVVDEYNNLLQQQMADDDESAHSNVSGEYEDDAELALLHKQRELEQQLQEVRAERRRMSTCRQKPM